MSNETRQPQSAVEQLRVIIIDDIEGRTCHDDRNGIDYSREIDGLIEVVRADAAAEIAAILDRHGVSTKGEFGEVLTLAGRVQELADAVSKEECRRRAYDEEVYEAMKDAGVDEDPSGEGKSWGPSDAIGHLYGLYSEEEMEHTHLQATLRQAFSRLGIPCTADLRVGKDLKECADMSEAVEVAVNEILARAAAPSTGEPAAVHFQSTPTVEQIEAHAKAHGFNWLGTIMGKWLRSRGGGDHSSAEIVVMCIRANGLVQFCGRDGWVNLIDNPLFQWMPYEPNGVPVGVSVAPAVKETQNTDERDSYRDALETIGNQHAFHARDDSSKAERLDVVIGIAQAVLAHYPEEDSDAGS